MYNTKFLYPCVMPLNIPDILISHFNTCSRKFIGIFLVIYDKFFQQMLTKIKKLLKHSYRNFASHSRLNNFV